MSPNSENSHAKLEETEVQHIAQLARLALTAKEVKQASAELNSIFEHINLLNTIDTQMVEPLDHPTEIVDRWREDEPQPVFTQAQALSNAPAVVENLIDVPKVLGNEST